MLTAVSPVLALPTYSSISFGGSPAAATLLGAPISSGMPASIPAVAARRRHRTRRAAPGRAPGGRADPGLVRLRPVQVLLDRGHPAHQVTGRAATPNCGRTLSFRQRSASSGHPTTSSAVDAASRNVVSASVMAAAADEHLLVEAPRAAAVIGHLAGP